MKCVCGAEIPAGARFCGKCGRPVPEKPKPVCPKCGAELMPGEKFCINCGAAVSDTGAKTAPATCRSCGAILYPGARFCGKCRTPVAADAPSAASAAADMTRKTAAAVTDVAGKFAASVKKIDTTRVIASATDTASRIAATVKKKADEIHLGGKATAAGADLVSGSEAVKKPFDNILVKIALGICLLALIAIFLPCISIPSSYQVYTRMVNMPSEMSLFSLEPLNLHFTPIGIILILLYITAAVLFYFDHPRFVLIPSIPAFLIHLFLWAFFEQTKSQGFVVTVWPILLVLYSIALIVFASIIKKANPKYVKVKVE